VDLTAKIRADLEVELEAKMNRIVQKNMSTLLQRLAEANPDLNLDLEDFCAAQSEDDEYGTPLTENASPVTENATPGGSTL
jgi:hypothetical protein